MMEICSICLKNLEPCDRKIEMLCCNKLICERHLESDYSIQCKVCKALTELSEYLNYSKLKAIKNREGLKRAKKELNEKVLLYDAIKESPENFPDILYSNLKLKVLKRRDELKSEFILKLNQYCDELIAEVIEIEKNCYNKFINISKENQSNVESTEKVLDEKFYNNLSLVKPNYAGYVNKSELDQEYEIIGHVDIEIEKYFGLLRKKQKLEKNNIYFDTLKNSENLCTETLNRSNLDSSPELKETIDDLNIEKESLKISPHIIESGLINLSPIDVTESMSIENINLDINSSSQILDTDAITTNLIADSVGDTLIPIGYPGFIDSSENFPPTSIFNTKIDDSFSNTAPKVFPSNPLNSSVIMDSDHIKSFDDFNPASIISSAEFDSGAMSSSQIDDKSEISEQSKPAKNINQVRFINENIYFPPKTTSKSGYLKRIIDTLKLHPNKDIKRNLTLSPSKSLLKKNKYTDESDKLFESMFEESLRNLQEMQNFDSISLQTLKEIVNELILKSNNKSISELLARTNLEIGLIRLKLQNNYKPINSDVVNKIIEKYFYGNQFKHNKTISGIKKPWSSIKKNLSDSNLLLKCLSSIEKKGPNKNSNVKNEDCYDKIRDLTNTMMLKGHNGKITCLKLLANNQIVTGSIDKTLKLWDLNNGECRKTFRGHSEQISMIDIINEDTIISGDYNGEVIIWNLKQLDNFEATKEINK